MLKMKISNQLTSLSIYTFAYTLYLIVFFSWGLIYNSNIYILILGIVFISIFFTVLIKIKYPQSLIDKKDKNYTVFTYFFENKSMIKSLVIIFLVGAFLSLGYLQLF